MAKQTTPTQIPPCDDRKQESLPQSPPSPPHSLGSRLNRATRFINQLAESNLALHDLTLPQWVVLTALWRSNGLKITHLADYCNNGQPALSRILDRMEAKDLVERCASPADRREVRVFLTEKGRSLSYLKEYLQQFNQAMMTGLNEQQQQMLFDLLDHLLVNGKKIEAGEITLAPIGPEA